MDKKLKRGLLLAVALVLSAACAFAADMLVYKYSGHFNTVVDDYPILEDGSEAFDFVSCSITDMELTVDGVDPHFTVAALEEEISLVRIRFGEPVVRDTLLQLFYSLPGESFSEKNSVYRTIKTGAAEERITIPKASYSLLRFDFEENVRLEKISIGNETRDYSPYQPHAVRLAVFFLAFFIPLGTLVFKLMKKREPDKN